MVYFQKYFQRLMKDCQAPVTSILLVGAMATIVAAFFSMDSIFELVNVGALSAFIFLALSVLILRYQKPEIKRSFKCPLVPAVPVLSIIFSLALISQLKSTYHPDICSVACIGSCYILCIWKIQGTVQRQGKTN